MWVLAMSFSCVYYPFQLSLAIPVLSFVFASVCITVLGAFFSFILSAMRTVCETLVLNIIYYSFTAMCASRIIYIVTTIAKCLVLMTVLSLASNSLLYAISVDPMATTIMCFEIGLLSCILCMSHAESRPRGAVMRVRYI